MEINDNQWQLKKMLFSNENLYPMHPLVTHCRTFWTTWLHLQDNSFNFAMAIPSGTVLSLACFNHQPGHFVQKGIFRDF